jgi:hypothetical protein
VYGSTSAPTAAQVEAAARLISATDASLVRFENVNNALAAGYTYRLATNGEEHLLYNGPNPAYQGLRALRASTGGYRWRRMRLTSGMSSVRTGRIATSAPPAARSPLVPMVAATGPAMAVAAGDRAMLLRAS